MFSQQISPPRPPGRASGDGEVVAGADPVEEALVHGRHQLAVLGEQALGADQEQGVVERAGALGLALVDADRAVDAELRARRGEPVDVGARDVHRVLPQPLPELVPALERGRVLGPAVGGVERHEGLGEHGQVDPSLCGLGEQPARLFDRGLGVEDHRRRLDRGDPNGRKARHATPGYARGPTVRRRGGGARPSARLVWPLGASRANGARALPTARRRSSTLEAGISQASTVVAELPATTAGWPSSGVVGSGVWIRWTWVPSASSQVTKGAIASGAAIRVKPSSGEELDRRLDVVGRDLERDVVKHAEGSQSK